MASTAENHYYVPRGAYWPLVGSVGLATTTGGLAGWLNEHPLGEPVFYIGLVILIVMMFGWFGTVIRESESGQYKPWEDKSFRLGMSWFIFSEVMFFAAFFGALFYARVFSVPWILGEGAGANTHTWLWNTFCASRSDQERQKAVYPWARCNRYPGFYFRLLSGS